jgi:hypothetical protein
MAKSPRTTKPRNDKTDEALLELAEVMLDEYFADIDDSDAYAALYGSGRGRRRAPPATILTRTEFEIGGAAVVMTGAKRTEFTVKMDHPMFQATVAMVYQPDDAEVQSSEIVAFTGSQKDARRTLEKWLEEILTFDEDDIAAIFGLEADDDDDGDLPFFGENPGTPPPATPGDAMRIQRIAGAVGRSFKAESGPELSDADQVWFETTPQTLWPILDGALAASTAKHRDDHLIAAFHFLLGAQLELIRYRIDSGWDWAKSMADSYQERMLQIAEMPGLKSEDWFEMVSALVRAKIDIWPDLRNQLGENTGGFQPEDMPEELMGAMQEMLAQMVERTPSEFDLVEAMAESGSVMPVGLMAFLVHEMARSPHAKLREAVPLMLLHPEIEVRRAAATVLEQIASPDLVSPVSLRRMIAVRNWLPEAERPGLDQAIRKARLKDVACAQWPAAADIVIVASTIDGSGAQSLLITTRTGRTSVFAGLLVKLRFGLRDTWFEPEQTRRETNDILGQIRLKTPVAEVDRGYLDVIAQHAIATGLRDGRVPGPNLLRIAEYAGGAEWRDRIIDVGSETAELFAGLDEAARTPAAIEASLQRSAAWITREAFAESWFEDDSAIRALIVRAPKRDRKAAIQLLLTEGLPPGRGLWVERMVLLGLWAAAAKEKDRKALGVDFITLAHVLAGDRPLADIPFMVGVAEKTVMVARSARW